MKQPKLTCPKCGKPQGVPLIYGFPSEDLFKQEERGEVVLGGCCLGTTDDGQTPDTGCTACDHQWRDPA